MAELNRAMANFTQEESMSDNGDESTERGMEVGHSSAEWRTSVTTRRGGVKRTAGSVLLFCGKLAALEVLRRGSQARCRFVWLALQGLSVSGAPALGWFRRWAPFRVLADAGEVSFSFRFFIF